MIETVMYLAIGALLSGLLAIALLPALWRRAERLSRQRLIAMLPMTPNEISAEKDQIRAAGAVEIRRLELRLDAADAQIQQARKDIGTLTTTLQRRDATLVAREAMISGLQSDVKGRDANIVALEGRIDELLRERDNLATNLNTTRISNQALDMEGSSLRQVAEQRQATLAAQEIQLEALTQKVTDFQTTAGNLRDDLRKKTEELRKTAKTLRETTARLSILERKLVAADALGADRLAQVERLQAERLRQIDEAGALLRERDGERIEREAREAEVARLLLQVSDLQATAERSRIANLETMRDLTRTIEALRQEKHQFDSELSSVRLENARMTSQITGQRPRAARPRRTPAE